MKRRTFIAGFGSAMAWPLAARAQQVERQRRVGILTTFAETDPEWRLRVAAFEQSLAKLGWTAGRNVVIDYRWAAGDGERLRVLAKELVEAQPDVPLADTLPSLATLRPEHRRRSLERGPAPRREVAAGFGERIDARPPRFWSNYGDSRSHHQRQRR
jgi:putative tryptophan/tyrosine transport system substrate-binding protein